MHVKTLREIILKDDKKNCFWIYLLVIKVRMATLYILFYHMCTVKVDYAINRWFLFDQIIPQVLEKSTDIEVLAETYEFL